MALNFFVKRCLTLIIFGSVGWDLVNGQFAYELVEARFELMFEKIAQLTEEMKTTREHFDNRLTKLTNASKHNEESIKEIKTTTDNISTCQVEHKCVISSTNSSGAGWLVVQQSFDRSIDFNRSWSDYRDGFGAVGQDNEFWWGLKRLHQFTKTGKYELLIELKDQVGDSRYARYSEFVVDGESEKYKLAKLGGYSGTAGDVNTLNISSSIPTGQKFSTYDNDNDRSSVNCADYLKGGWWYNSCGYSLNSNSDTVWDAWKRKILPYTRMLIRAK